METRVKLSWYSWKIRSCIYFVREFNGEQSAMEELQQEREVSAIDWTHDDDDSRDFTQPKRKRGKIVYSDDENEK